MSARNFFFSLVTALSLLLTACNYDAPLTAQPTHPVDARLLGNWVTQDGDKTVTLLVRRLDDNTYVFDMDGDLYRAFHSDFAGLPFVSVQNLQEGSDHRKYVYAAAWLLSLDGKNLTLRCVNPTLIPPQSTPTAGMQQLIKQKIQDPALFGDPIVYHRPPAQP